MGGMQAVKWDMGGGIVSLTSASKVQPRGAGCAFTQNVKGSCSEGGRGFVIMVLRRDTVSSYLFFWFFF